MVNGIIIKIKNSKTILKQRFIFVSTYDELIVLYNCMCSLFNMYLVSILYFSLKFEFCSNLTIFFFFFNTLQDLTNKIVGDSRVVYDEKKIIEGNFTRKFSRHGKNFMDDNIDLTVQNKMLPLGVRYLCRTNNESHVATENSPKIVSNDYECFFFFCSYYLFTGTFMILPFKQYAYVGKH